MSAQSEASEARHCTFIVRLMGSDLLYKDIKVMWWRLMLSAEPMTTVATITESSVNGNQDKLKKMILLCA